MKIWFSYSSYAHSNTLATHFLGQIKQLEMSLDFYKEKTMENIPFTMMKMVMKIMMMEKMKMMKMKMMNKMKLMNINKIVIHVYL